MRVKAVVFLAVLFLATATFASTFNYLQPVATGTTGVGTVGINAGANAVNTQYSLPILYNNTSQTFTDLTVVWNNPTAGAAYADYGCFGGSFVNCSGPNSTDGWTWHFFDVDATHTGIAAGEDFILQAGGSVAWNGTNLDLTITPSFTAAPEPATLALLGTGLLGLGFQFRKRR